MKFWNARILNKWIYVVILLVIVSVILFFNQSKQLKNRSKHIELEIAEVSQFFEKNTDYSINKIPSWASVAPCLVSVERLHYPKYLIQLEEYINTGVGFYYYPFESKKAVMKYYNRLTQEEKSKFFWISNSLIYIGELDAENTDIFISAKDYFESLK